MFESKYLSTPDELKQFDSLKTRFYCIKKASENSISQMEKSIFSGKNAFPGLQNQLTEVKRKVCIMNQIEPLLVPEYRKLTEFCFYFNNGNFRSDSEIKEYKNHRIKEDWFICDDFNKQCFWVMAISAVFALIFLMIPYLIMGRGAIMLYLIPVWPLITVLIGFGTYKILMKLIWNFTGRKNNMKKMYTADTALAFIRKFY